MDKTITINGIEYIPKEEKTKDKEYVIIRTCSAGVHAGYLKSRKGTEVELINTRRIWYWSGACSLSQLAKDGTLDPDKCKFSVEIQRITVLGVNEVIPCTNKAHKSIQGVEAWKK